MKRLLMSFFALAFYLMGIGQDVEPFNYQAIVHNAAGEIVVSQDISIKFSILAGSTSGKVVYCETHGGTTDQSGLISLVIGSGKDETGNFYSIDWSANRYFLKVETDLSGGSSYTEMGITQLLIIPYELPAESSRESSPIFEEDELLIVRKYLGSFIDYRQTGPETHGGPNIIWIKTTMENIFGKISAYGRKCDFSVGDNLYLKRSYYSPGGIVGYWQYHVENDSSVFYRVSDFQHDNKVLVETWFR